MLIFLVLLLATIAAELLMVVRPLWSIRRVWAAILLPVLAFASAGLFAIKPDVAVGLVCLVSVYRGFALFRIIKARIEPIYLRRSTTRSALSFASIQLVTLLFAFGPWGMAGMRKYAVLALALVQFAAAMILFASTLRQVRKTLPLPQVDNIGDHSLPSVTVAIPARNEDEELQHCLQSVLANNYPKLEVLVLDDCSHDKTPEILRGYAHDGVRFLKGKEPTEGWLSKNQAYAQLAEQASGELILFCGTDVRFEPHSIRELVKVMLRKEKVMLSVLPTNRQVDRLPLIQSMRYWWEMAPPRRLFQRPPVLSTCWLIRKSFLKKSGGFAAVSRMIVPESYFARESIKSEDSYSFVRSNTRLGIVTMKNTRAQLNTAIRTRYPQLHRRPEMVLLVSLAELGLLLGPFALLPFALWFDQILIAFLAFTAGTVNIFTYSYLASKIFPDSHLLPFVTFPVALIVDVALLHFSMWKYEFSEVTWKGRNVCLPVMHVVPRLPNLPPRR